MVSVEKVHCTKCGADNREGAKFCSECATPFAAKCPKCGAVKASGAKFCDECGISLSAPSNNSVSAQPQVQAREVVGERRHLTVLFCDVVGSTAIAAQLDPEEWREILAGFHRAAAAAITRFEGHVAKNLGDGVMAYFGWPSAHDNDGERAARAGLAILDAIAKLDELPGHVKLAVRIGIDSGPVVVGGGAGHSADVFGDTPNIAKRVEAAAEPGTVAISDAAQRLVSGLFVVEDLGAQQLKGIEQPLQLYRVVRPSGVRGRFQAATAAGGLTAFVGREDELRSLTSKWERVLDGEGQVALIIGEAGIGKSRLVQRFHEQIVDTPHTSVEAGAGAFFQNTPFYPISEILRQFVGEASPPDQIAELERRLTAAGLKPAEAIPLLATLLNLPLPAEYPPSGVSPEQQRRRLLATLVEWVLGSARTQPLVMAIEDLHWVDPSTLELIQLLVEQGATSRLLLLYTARPEFRAPWPMRTHHTQITLNRLGARDIRTIVAQVAASKALSDETIAAVVERTGGVPLFIEELTRAVLESGNAKLTGREIPATLHDSLMARLDRLGAAKEVAQVAAVIGREFSYELLRAVHSMPEEDFRGALGELADAELLYVRGIAPDATYQFKHALIQDAAYEALLKSRRKELHLSVARTIDEQFPTLKEAHPEVLARHWTEAGEIEAAIAEWTRAGRAAEARNAFREALESYQQALALLDLLPESAERDTRELELRQSAYSMLAITRGYAAPQTTEAIERAIPLAEKSGNLPQLVKLLMTRGSIFLVAGNLSTAAAFADRALELGLRHGGNINLAPVHQLQTVTRFWLGDLVGAEKHFTSWLQFFNDPHFAQSAPSTLNISVNALAFGSSTAWALGRPNVAQQREHHMLAVAKLGTPFEVANSEYCAATIELYIGNYKRAEALAAHALELGEQYQFPNPVARSRTHLGRIRAQLGRATEGVALIRQGLADLREIGTRMGITQSLANLAEAQALEGATVEALETIEQALNANPEELVRRPEMLRIRGELRLKQGNAELAETDFCEATILAKGMSAKSWELRATMSLARLLRDTGRRDEARAMLADIYSWFTEGFDTADLKDAKALLEQLGA
jgi:class 3 adenylate cyclase/tetratricopeptide (TPR) repeat protein